MLGGRSFFLTMATVEIKIEGKDRYVLKDDKGCTTYLLESSMCDVLPYNGKSKNLDGKGVGKSKSKRTEFLQEVAGLKRNEIPAITMQEKTKEKNLLIQNALVQKTP